MRRGKRGEINRVEGAKELRVGEVTAEIIDATKVWAEEVAPLVVSLCGTFRRLTLWVYSFRLQTY